MEDRPVTNVLLALQGTSPNLIIQQTNFEPGQGVNLNIRGLGTTGDNTPLIVIDGIPGGDINLLNPNDIESVSILKDAGSAAIYGSRSANGVILVTTKRVRRTSQPSSTMPVSTVFSRPVSRTSRCTPGRTPGTRTNRW
ncbi:TonB-dependent receptor plug domain-containing protein [Puia sp. P3]|uniref:TonB-dependent receptor plug domain-containing protein n=1 Tax=Puia sp. P3 TaxID=3423952 RepID=UPI003D676E38